uniref:Secreted RxLR effector protein 54 n=1 Tax=Plasmopara viticola TaxID=143451 RepID=RLR54_PLAVT|nr:RecName: Full=Secreted RxLR effector protein 54; Flags: Precursor [Plasmopara viticola]
MIFTLLGLALVATKSACIAHVFILQLGALDMEALATPLAKVIATSARALHTRSLRASERDKCTNLTARSTRALLAHGPRLRHAVQQQAVAALFTIAVARRRRTA